MIKCNNEFEFGEEVFVTQSPLQTKNIRRLIGFTPGGLAITACFGDNHIFDMLRLRSEHQGTSLIERVGLLDFNGVHIWDSCEKLEQESDGLVVDDTIAFGSFDEIFLSSHDSDVFFMGEKVFFNGEEVCNEDGVSINNIHTTEEILRIHNWRKGKNWKSR